MKKAIGAFVSGLFLAGVAAAISQSLRKGKSAQSERGRRTTEQQQPIAPVPMISDLLDLNSCRVEDLLALEGMEREIADRIFENRP